MTSRRRALHVAAATFLVAVVAGLSAWSVSGPAPAASPRASRPAHAATPLPGAVQSRLFSTDRDRPLKVVALGDSIQSGHNCDCTDYVQTVSDRVASTLQRPLELRNTAVSGFRTDDVLGLLEDHGVRSAIADAELVIVEIGANDFDPLAEKNSDPNCLPVEERGCFDEDMAEMTEKLHRIVADAHSLQGPPTSHMVVLGYWNVFPEGDVGRERGGDTYLAVGDQLTRWSNRETARIARSVGALYADAYTPFKGDGGLDDTPLLAPDGEHPDAAGHEVLADAVLDSLRRARAGARTHPPVRH